VGVPEALLLGTLATLPVLATWDIRPKNESFSENGCPT